MKLTPQYSKLPSNLREAHDAKLPVMGSASDDADKVDKYEGYHKCPNCGIRHGQINEHINHMELCNVISLY